MLIIVQRDATQSSIAVQLPPSNVAKLGHIEGR